MGPGSGGSGSTCKIDFDSCPARLLLYHRAALKLGRSNGRTAVDTAATNCNTVHTSQPEPTSKKTRRRHVASQLAAVVVLQSARTAAVYQESSVSSSTKYVPYLRNRSGSMSRRVIYEGSPLCSLHLRVFVSWLRRVCSHRHQHPCDCCPRHSSPPSPKATPRNAYSTQVDGVEHEETTNPPPEERKEKSRAEHASAFSSSQSLTFSTDHSPFITA